MECWLSGSFCLSTDKESFFEDPGPSTANWGAPSGSGRGSLRGLGLALADAFLAAGCHVTVCGRSEAAVESARAQLAAKHPADRVHGRACDVAKPEDLRALWDEAKRATGRVDVWINNAGAGMVQRPLVEQTLAELTAVVQVNLLGTVIATRVVVEQMLAQVLAKERPYAEINWLTLPKIVGRFVSPQYRRRDLFADQRAPSTI